MASASESSRESSDTKGEDGEISDRIVDRRNTNFLENESYMFRSKEHCLMGIKGTVRRSIDTAFIHANIDADVIVAEEPEVFGSTEKPHELYEVIEHFCMGRRRLELFGTDNNLREGWVTVGRDLSMSNWDKRQYSTWFEGGQDPKKMWPQLKDHRGGTLLGSEDVIEVLRPKSVEREREMQRVLKESEKVGDLTERDRAEEAALRAAAAAAEAAQKKMEEERLLPEDGGEAGGQQDPLEDGGAMPETVRKLMTKNLDQKEVVNSEAVTVAAKKETDKAKTENNNVNQKSNSTGPTKIVTTVGESNQNLHIAPLPGPSVPTVTQGPPSKPRNVPNIQIQSSLPKATVPKASGLSSVVGANGRRATVTVAASSSGSSSSINTGVPGTALGPTITTVARSAPLKVISSSSQPQTVASSAAPVQVQSLQNPMTNSMSGGGIFNRPGPVANQNPAQFSSTRNISKPDDDFEDIVYMGEADSDDSEERQVNQSNNHMTQNHTNHSHSHSKGGGPGSGPGWHNNHMRNHHGPNAGGSHHNHGYDSHQHGGKGWKGRRRY